MAMDQVDLESILQYREDDDIVDNIKGVKFRGKFRISKDGSCPRCKCKNNKFIILDFLFPTDEMPYILDVLLKQEKAVTWSSQDSSKCKEAPTFLCGGRCPSIPRIGGFNVNWKFVDLETLYFPELVTQEDSEKKVLDSLPKVVKMEEKASKLVGLLPKVKTGSGREMYQVVLEGDQTLKKVESADESEGDMSIDDEDIDDNNGDEKDAEIDETMETDCFDPSEIDFCHYSKLAKWTVLDEEVFEKEEYDSSQTDVGILTMLALEGAKVDWAEGNLKFYDETTTPDLPTEDASTAELIKQQQTPIDNDKDVTNKLAKTVAATTKVKQLKPIKSIASNNGKKAKFPVSKDGTCPYCKSDDVVYIILMYKDSKPDDLPPILRKLIQKGVAMQLKKGDTEPPSFQCQTCSYGFNLDWSNASLESIFSVSAKDGIASPPPSLNSNIPLAKILPEIPPPSLPFPPAFPPPFPGPMIVPPPIPNFNNPISIPPPPFPNQQPWINPGMPPPMQQPCWREPFFPPFNLPPPEQRPFMRGKWFPPPKPLNFNNPPSTRPFIPVEKVEIKIKTKAEPTEELMAAPGAGENAEIDFVL